MTRDGSVIIETFSHATEDKAKVKKAILFLLPEEYRNKVEIEEQQVMGHWNNPITILRIRVMNKLKSIFLKRLASLLSEEDKEYLKNTLHLRLDSKKNLYIRIDKQAAYNDMFILNDSDDDIIKIKIPLSGKWIDKKKIFKKIKDIGII